eukprot:s692_g18.t1
MVNRRTAVLDELTFPYSPKEPDLSSEELMRLDALADQLELQRLEKLQVLQDPSSVPACSKDLANTFLERREIEDYIICSLDVKDAFLTDVQACPTLVHTTDASGNSRSYALGRVLPGQRDGSLLWYKSITSFLKKHLDLEEHVPYAQYTIRHLSTYSSKPTEKPSGIYHQYPDVDQSENVLEVFTDSDWASDPKDMDLSH